MARLYLVRHGRAAAGWDTAVDPPLDEVGVQQAGSAAFTLLERIESHTRSSEIEIVTSPLRRCQETAAAFVALAGRPARVEPRIAEIPSPEGVAMGDRITWLRRAMQGTWAELARNDGAVYEQFRARLVQWAGAVRRDTVAFSHFVAINALIGAAQKDDRLVIRSLDNASITTIEVEGDASLTLIDGGNEADTLIR